jgi:hypothetical protein
MGIRINFRVAKIFELVASRAPRITIAMDTMLCVCYTGEHMSHEARLLLVEPTVVLKSQRNTVDMNSQKTGDERTASCCRPIYRTVHKNLKNVNSVKLHRTCPACDDD